MSDLLDPTDTVDQNKTPETEDTHDEISDDVVETEAPKKKKGGGFIKAILIIGLILFLVVAGLGGFIYYQQLSSSNKPEWSTVEPDLQFKEPNNLQDIPLEVEPLDAPIFKEPKPPVFKVGFKKDHIPTKDQSHISNAKTGGDYKEAMLPDVIGPDKPLTAMEQLASSEDQVPSGYSADEHGHAGLGEDDLHESVLSELRFLKEQQELHENRFKSFDLAATALHRAHKEQIDKIAVSQQRTDATLINMQSELIGIKKQLEKGLPQDELKTVVDQVKATKKSLDKLVAQSKQNDRNIKWMSRERFCFLEAQMGITKYSKQCSSFNKKHQTTVPLAINSIPSQAASVSPTYSNNPQIPATIGKTANPKPVANTTMLATSRPSNPCEFADRTWKIQLISGNNALLVRNTDGFETVVEEQSPVPGLGRAQLFNATGYPQYVQFTNGIVCGG